MCKRHVHGVSKAAVNFCCWPTTLYVRKASSNGPATAVDECQTVRVAHLRHSPYRKRHLAHVETSHSCHRNGCDRGADADWLKQLVDQRDDSGREALAAAAELAVRSSHPVSQAVLACRKQAASKLPRVRLIDFKLVPGSSSHNSIMPCPTFVD
jgi:hypothetical protein